MWSPFEVDKDFMSFRSNKAAIKGEITGSLESQQVLPSKSRDRQMQNRRDHRVAVVVPPAYSRANDRQGRSTQIGVSAGPRFISAGLNRPRVPGVSSPRWFRVERQVVRVPSVTAVLPISRPQLVCGLFNVRKKFVSISAPGEAPSSIQPPKSGRSCRLFRVRTIGKGLL